MTPFYYAEESRRNYDNGDPTFAVFVKLAVQGQVHLKNPVVFRVEGSRTLEQAWNGAVEWANELDIEVVRPEDLGDTAKLPVRGEE